MADAILDRLVHTALCGVDSIYYRVVDGIAEIMRILGRQVAEEWLSGLERK